MRLRGKAELSLLGKAEDTGVYMDDVHDCTYRTVHTELYIQNCTYRTVHIEL